MIFERGFSTCLEGEGSLFWLKVVLPFFFKNHLNGVDDLSRNYTAVWTLVQVCVKVYITFTWI